MSPGSDTSPDLAARFGARLYDAMADRGPLCAGIDPHAGLLREWGVGDDVAGLERFALTAVEGLAPHVAVVKPQSAFFERFGSRGIAVLERVVVDARAAGALVLLDVKRGDIGSTSQAYADAYFDPASPLACDAITATPYLGFGSLQPMLDTARRHGGGVFVLALTSNREGPEVQGARTDTGESVAARVLDHLRGLNADKEPLGSFGAVVGATLGDLDDLEAGGVDLDVGGPILAPGFGAQGGTTADLARLFGSLAGRVLPSSSRGLLALGPDVAALAEGARRVNDELRDAFAGPR